MVKYQKVNNIIGWIIFAVAAFVYLSTIEPTASFWDCGEYIATSYKLEVGHPPGAPLFQLIARFFSLFAMGDVTQAAKWINAMSGLCSAFTILFLFWTITAFAKKMAVKSGDEITKGKLIAIMGSGMVGALAYTFSDSFWFSAVEGEVYAMSSFFTAIVFWCILKWERVADEPDSNRWIVFIAYLVGLSIGVHMLNLLTIPAICFVYYYKKNAFTIKSFIITGIVSVLILGGVLVGIIPGIINLAQNFEITFVNKFGLFFNSGTLFYALILIGFVVFGLLYTIKPTEKGFKIFAAIGILFYVLSLISSADGSVVFGRLVMGGAIGGLIYYIRTKYALLNTVLLSFALLLVGYSTFAVLVIRAQAKTPMDENNPENAINLLSYLNREQYGDWPLLYGQYYNAPLDAEKPYTDGNPVYVKDLNTKKYIITDDRKGIIPNYDPKFCTLFPRMYSDQSSHVAGYKRWGNVKGEKMAITNNRGERETVDKPTFGENLTFMFTYQIKHMYLRYLFWNFVGRQNDVQGNGNDTDGNGITGIKFIDEMFHGPQDKLPESMLNNGARNIFYGLPLLLGLFGMFFHFKSDNKDAFVVTLLVFFTGLAIVLYLNQCPYQPRERDYAYAASFYAFAIWIGLAVIGFTEALKNKFGAKLPERGTAIAITLIGLIIAPGLMAKDGWDDHDRSKRYTARDFAIDYLNSCAPNAILFTNGDNDTFPLWYVQEVEGIRTDVRVCNLSLLNTDWYIDQMKRKAYDSDPVPFSLTSSQYRQGTRDVVYFFDQKLEGNVKLRELIDYIGSDNADHKVQAGSGREVNYFPTQNFRIPVDSSKVLGNGTVPKALANRVLKSIDWKLDKNYLMKSELMVLDLLATNNWDRPIYFAVTTGPESYLELQDYFQLEGLAYRLVPIKAKPEEQSQGVRVATDIMYNNVMNKFKWGGMEKPGVYLDENIIRMTTNMRIQMGTLASALIAEGKKDSAIKVLDKCVEVMPEGNVAYDPTMFAVTVSYYQAGALKQPNKLAKRLFDIFEGELRYYYSMGQANAAIYSREIRQDQDILQKLVYVTQNFKQDNLSKEFEARLNKLQGNVGVQQAQQPGARR